MQFILLTYEAPADFDARHEPVASTGYWARWKAYGEALKAAGVVRGMHGLQPGATATTVRLAAGERTTQTGPFGEAPAVLGGYFVIDVKDHQAAEDWAARCPAARNGAVEVRPVL